LDLRQAGHQFSVRDADLTFNHRRYQNDGYQRNGRRGNNTGSHHSIGTPSVGLPTYVATKHAVLGFTEAFQLEYGSRIGFSILCPGIVNTNAWDAGRNRPAELGGPTQGSPQNQAALQAYGLAPEFVGQLVAKGIINEESFIWTHPFTIELIEKRYQECRDSIQRQWPHGPLPIHKRTPSRVC
jgi:NAD(P)-dependent dehydrogenase (short-subunit alcohol dehydrogenase family)